MGQFVVRRVYRASFELSAGVDVPFADDEAGELVTVSASAAGTDVGA